MTHMRQMEESEGTFNEAKPSDRKCPKCGSPMTSKTWESSDGAYEDEKYTCTSPACGNVVWVDGIDS